MTWYRSGVLSGIEPYSSESSNNNSNSICMASVVWSIVFQVIVFIAVLLYDVNQLWRQMSIESDAKLWKTYFMHWRQILWKIQSFSGFSTVGGTGGIPPLFLVPTQKIFFVVPPQIPTQFFGFFGWGSPPTFFAVPTQNFRVPTQLALIFQNDRYFEKIFACGALFLNFDTWMLKIFTSGRHDIMIFQ